MAYTAPRTWVAGELVTASHLNTHLRDNMIALRAGEIALASQAANDIIYASSDTQLARSTTLPSAVQDNITRVGALASMGTVAVGITLSLDAPGSPTAHTLYRDTLVRVWANIANSGSPTINNDVNVASLTDNDVGDVTVTFANGLDTTTYAAMANPRSSSTRRHAAVHTQGQTSLRVFTHDDAAGAAVDVDFNVLVIGR